jgi:hypothetical protein
MLPIQAGSVRRNKSNRLSPSPASSFGMIPAAPTKIVVPALTTIECESGNVCRCNDGRGIPLPFHACDCRYGCELQTDPRKELYGSCVCK